MAKKGNYSNPINSEYLLSSNKGFSKAMGRVIKKGTNEGVYFTKEQLKDLSEKIDGYDGIWFAIGSFGSVETIELLPINIESSNIKVVQSSGKMGFLNIHLDRFYINNDSDPVFRNLTAKKIKDLESDPSEDYDTGGTHEEGTEGVSQRTPPPFPR